MYTYAEESAATRAANSPVPTLMSTPLFFNSLSASRTAPHCTVLPLPLTRPHTPPLSTHTFPFHSIPLRNGAAGVVPAFSAEVQEP